MNRKIEPPAGSFEADCTRFDRKASKQTELRIRSATVDALSVKAPV
jgi:hypothetical protein